MDYKLAIRGMKADWTGQVQIRDKALCDFVVALWTEIQDPKTVSTGWQIDNGWALKLWSTEITYCIYSNTIVVWHGNHKTSMYVGHLRLADKLEDLQMAAEYGLYKTWLSGLEKQTAEIQAATASIDIPF